MKQPSEEVQRLLKEVIDHFNKEDVAVRERQIRTWRRLKLFWESFQRAWYSEVAHDWRVWDNSTSDDTEQAYYDKPINVFRAYLESIIAALSVTVPPIKCYPDDADDTLDLSTARAGDKIAQLIFRHNNVSLLWLHALFIFVTEGLVACYSYPKEDESYGTYDEKKYDETSEQHQLVTCPNCGFQINDSVVPPPGNSPNNLNSGIQPSITPTQQIDEPIISPQQREEELEFDEDDEYMPYDEEQEQDECPACGLTMTPEVSQQEFIVTRLVGVTKKPKARICMEAYGGLYVKIPNWAKKQEDCPYLKFAYETHYANAIEKFEHLHGNKDLTNDNIRTQSGPKDPYEEWGRLSPQYQGEYPLHTVTINSWWLRPCAFNVLGDIDDVKRMKRLYPKGCKVILVNDEFGNACTEALDDCWSLTWNPLSDYMHHDPLGTLLVSIQEMTNDLISLSMQTIEHGIGQTFADPGVLNFNAYRQLEAVPGGIYEAVPKSGKSLGDAFFSERTATLSPETMEFGEKIQTLAQLVSGALPSLFGGNIQDSNTASQYSMSRAQALQRLQNVWKIFTSWWKEIFGKVIPMYISEIKDDERDVQRDQNGNFINVFIRKAELEGKIGRIELEANENLPITWAQQKDTVMQLLQSPNLEILQVLGTPENIPVIRDVLGLTDFFVPDEEDRNKQFDEIKVLLMAEPSPSMDPQNPEESSILPDPDYDNHQIHFAVVKDWVTSEAGRQAKMDNPNGYKNVLLHGKAHKMLMGPPTPSTAQQANRPNPPMMQEAPITGESNVPTIQ